MTWDDKPGVTPGFWRGVRVVVAVYLLAGLVAVTLGGFQP